jgi:hypothetical protein
MAHSENPGGGRHTLVQTCSLTADRYRLPCSPLVSLEMKTDGIYERKVAIRNGVVCVAVKMGTKRENDISCSSGLGMGGGHDVGVCCVMSSLSSYNWNRYPKSHTRWIRLNSCRGRICRRGRFFF